MLLLKDSLLRFQEGLVAAVGFLGLLEVPAEILHLLIMPFMTGGKHWFQLCTSSLWERRGSRLRYLTGPLKSASFCHCIYPRVGDKVSLLGAWVHRGNGAVPYIRSGRKRKPFVTTRMFGT